MQYPMLNRAIKKQSAVDELEIIFNTITKKIREPLHLSYLCHNIRKDFTSMYHLIRKQKHTSVNKSIIKMIFRYTKKTKMACI